MQRYTNDDVITILKNLSRELGRKRLSHKDISTVIPVSAVAYRFGNVGNALEAAGLERNKFIPKRKSLTEDELFLALYETEIIVGREPGYFDCRMRCRYSEEPYRARYGKWTDVLGHYRKWKEKNEEKLDEILKSKSFQYIEAGGNRDKAHGAVKSPIDSCDPDKKPAPEELYGEPLDFRGLRNAPTNEQGVVFLFGMVGRELGFYVESIQHGYPDCEVKYLFDPNKNLWARAKLEFEFKASLFREHHHDPEGCDFVVCWIDDWPECPIHVIELKTEITKLPNV